MMGKSNIAGLQVNALSIRIKVPRSQAGSFQTGIPSVLLTPSQSSLWGGLYWVHFPQQQFWPKYVTVNCYIFLNLAWHWSLAVLSSCVGRCEPVGGVCSHSVPDPVLLRDSGLTPTSESQAQLCPAPPLPLRGLFCPLLPSFGYFFLLPAFSCLFFLPSCSPTCTKHCLFLILPLLFSLPPDLLYFYFILILIPFPGSWAGG